MIRYEEGNLLASGAEALVNTVNEVGVMGRGIALMFRDAFPENTRLYQQAAKRKEIRVGHIFATATGSYTGPRWIVNFPTKRHWRNPSRLEWVSEGLDDLVSQVQRLGIRSIALPPLGCGNGGLDWEQVRPLIERFAQRLPDVDVIAYAPTAHYQNKPKERGVEHLTPARALIAELVRQYSILGLDCTILEVQKLAWFISRELQRHGLRDPLKLQFQANSFGPYDDRLRHLLDGLDGSYLHADKRLADASPFDLIRFEDRKGSELAAYLRSEAMETYLPALEATVALIDGFESPLGMELLATVDWLVSREAVKPSAPAVAAALGEWPGGADAAARKRRLFTESMLTIALQRLVPAGSANAAQHRLFGQRV